jgi:hypothetical protein
MAQDGGKFLAAGNIVTPDAKDTRPRAQGPPGDLVDHVIIAGITRGIEAYFPGFFIDGAVHHGIVQGLHVLFLGSAIPPETCLTEITW